MCAYAYVLIHACLYDIVVSRAYCISTNLVVLKTLNYVCVCVCVCACVRALCVYVCVWGVCIRSFPVMVVVSLKLINQLLVKMVTYSNCVYSAVDTYHL